ncbi:MAG: hypothetical protein ACRCXG_02990 [Vibrio sp.]
MCYLILNLYATRFPYSIRMLCQIEHSEMPSEVELDGIWREHDFIESEK